MQTAASPSVQGYCPVWVFPSWSRWGRPSIARQKSWPHWSQPCPHRLHQEEDFMSPTWMWKKKGLHSVLPLSLSPRVSQTCLICCYKPWFWKGTLTQVHTHTLSPGHTAFSSSAGYPQTCENLRSKAQSQQRERCGCMSCNSCRGTARDRDTVTPPRAKSPHTPTAWP